MAQGTSWSSMDLSDVPRGLRQYLNVPAKALGHSRREQLGMYLNPRRQDISDRGLLKDWRGLAERLGFSSLEIDNFDINNHPTPLLLRTWLTKDTSLIGHLLEALCAMQRYDILGDSELMTMIEEDIRKYLQEEERRREANQNPVQVPDVSESMEVDEYLQMTIGETPGCPEYFDAYVCYTSTDFAFVEQMMNKLEGHHGLKLCVPNRDLTAGCAEYTIMARLIKERCRKVIIILSPDYQRNDQCDFITKFAVQLSPGAREKKLIPVVYQQPCVIPDILSPICLLDYTRCDVVDWFWNRLANSLKKDSIVRPQPGPAPGRRSPKAPTRPQTEPVASVSRVGPAPVPVNHTAPVRRTNGDQLILPDSYDEPKAAATAQGTQTSQRALTSQRAFTSQAESLAAQGEVEMFEIVNVQHFGMDSQGKSRSTGPPATKKK